jgi:probable lipoprotein NlpC
MFKWLFFIFCLIFLTSCSWGRRVNFLSGLKHTSKSNNFSNKEITNLLESAMEYQGTPYQLGGVTEVGMDCSGLLFRVYTDNDFVIPRLTSQQAIFGSSIPLDKIQLGDWLFFRTNKSTSVNHVGLVLAVDGERNVHFIHASTSKGVRSDQLFSTYWLKSFDRAIRPFKNISN